MREQEKSRRNNGIWAEEVHGGTIGMQKLDRSFYLVVIANMDWIPYQFTLQRR